MSIPGQRIFLHAAVIACLALLTSILPGSILPAGAAQRVALVIGNSKYAAAPVLKNPVSDAQDLAASLRGLGFDVIELEDATRTNMADAIRNFSGKLAGADTALFFYAGHGLQLNGENYLVPVDAHVQGVADVRFGTIDLNDIMGEMDGKDRANIIILDSCRDNPFAEVLSKAGRSIGSTRGLGRVDDTGVGTLVVYSTQPNNVALDGDGRNSPFTSALLKHVATPGLEIRQMISRVRSDVLDATNRVQVPWDNSSLVGEVYLSAAREPAPTAAAAPASAAPANAASSLPGSDTAELLFWQSVARADSKEMYQGYLSRYGDKGQFAFLARQRIEELSKVAALPPPSAPAAVRSAPDVPATDTAAKPAGGAPITDCDRDAAPVAAMVKLPGVDGKDISAIDPVTAVPACQSAVQQYPDESRFKYDLGRAQIAAKNFIEANQSYEAAVKGGNVDAISGLGVSYFLGRGVPQSYQRAFELFSKGDELNNPDAMVGLGQMYADGHFVPKDPGKAQAYYGKAIALGNYVALRSLGFLYYSGNGVPRDYAMALNYFKQASAHGDAAAMDNLGVMYLNGTGVQRDYALARSYYEQAAARGSAEAMQSLGVIYQNGNGVPRDPAMARSYFAQAVAHGYVAPPKGR